jgi:hypothetical protein
VVMLVLSFPFGLMLLVDLQPKTTMERIKRSILIDFIMGFVLLLELQPF